MWCSRDADADTSCHRRSLLSRHSLSTPPSHSQTRGMFAFLALLSLPLLAAPALARKIHVKNQCCACAPRCSHVCTCAYRLSSAKPTGLVFTHFRATRTVLLMAGRWPRARLRPSPSVTTGLAASGVALYVHESTSCSTVSPLLCRAVTSAPMSQGTGGCNGGFSCTAGPVGPTTVAELMLAFSGGDWYDVSVSDPRPYSLCLAQPARAGGRRLQPPHDFGSRQRRHDYGLVSDMLVS